MYVVRGTSSHTEYLVLGHPTISSRTFSFSDRIPAARKESSTIPGPFLAPLVSHQNSLSRLGLEHDPLGLNLQLGLALDIRRLDRKVDNVLNKPQRKNPVSPFPCFR